MQYQKHRVVFCLTAWLLVFATQALGVSAYRHPEEDFVDAKARNVPFTTWAPSSKSAMDSAVAYKSIDTRKLPRVIDAVKMFEFIRDARVLHTVAEPTFDRRSSWLYPQDGCWIRAAIARHLAKQQKYGDLQKLFIFGNLQVKTSHAPGGAVTWWYHVVPVFSDDKGVTRVIDPAIDPHDPLELKQWILAQVKDVKDATYAICSPATYGPTDICTQTNDKADAYAERDQESYLDMEWENLESLGRNAEEELGDYPPWLTVPIPTV